MNRVALVTGASGGIGAAIALRLAEDGFALALQYHTNRAAIDALIDKLPDGTAWCACACDLCDAAETERMLSMVRQRLGRVSLLVNCAGIAPKQTLFSDTDDAALRAVFETDVYAPMRLARLLTGDLRETRGSVVTISSMWGVCGASCEVIYSAAKAALIGFTKALARELAPEGVRVNCVAPGMIQTAMNAHLGAEAIEAFRRETPLERIGKPEDVAEAVAYLVKASFVTGQTLSVDGGIVI